MLDVGGITETDEAAWRDLAVRAVEPNPFFEPDCVIPAARHQQNGNEIRLCLAEQEGRFLACVPFRSTWRWKVPYPMVTTHVRRMHYFGSPLVDAAGGAEAVAVMLQGLAAERRVSKGRALVLEESSADGPVPELVRTACDELGFPVLTMDVHERGLLARRPDADYEKLQSSEQRSVLRRRRRRLSEHFGGAEVNVVSRTDRSAIDEYVAMEGAGYKARIGVAMSTVPGEPEYFREMCERFRRSGRLSVFALEVGGRTLAFELGIRAGDGLFMMKSSYDEDFARFGVGILLHTAAMAAFHDCTDARWIDTCTYKGNSVLLRLYPGRRRLESLCVLLGNGLADRAAMRTFTAVRPIHRSLYRWRHRERTPAGESRSREA